MRRLLGLFCLVAMAGAAQAADTFLEGDVFASTSAGRYEQWRKVAGVWTKIDTLTTGLGGFTTGSAFDDAGNLYGTNFSNANVSKFTGPGVAHTHSTFATADAASSVESILFDATGDIYVGQADGTRDILKLDPVTGAIVDRYDVATEGRGSDWIDLAADQTTMYYTSEGRTIKRYDLATDTQLADFATLSGGGIAFAFRLLSDGGLLVADSGNVKRLDSTGAEIGSYDVASVDGFFALNLDPDGTSFWTGSFSNGVLYKFDIASGVLLDSFDTGAGSSALFGVSVFGEITESNPPTNPIPLPAAVWMGLSLMGGLGVAQYRRRRSMD
jgi:hypothetical protein